MLALRGYQQEAVDNIVSILGDGGRTQLVAACGTGKTLVAVHAAMRLAASDLVVVAAPSLALIAQTLGVWAASRAAGRVLAACSDQGVADAAVRVADLACSVTTQPEEIAGWLRQASGGDLRLMLTTYVSAHAAAAGLVKADAVADLLVLDEAHHAAGRRDKASAVVHDDGRLPAVRRLYMTATPRLLAGSRRGGRADVETVASMDDPVTFGPVCYRYPFARAIADDVSDDFRVVVIGVTRRDVLQLLRQMDPAAVVQDTNASLRTIVQQAALAQAACEFGLRRVLVFCSRVADSKLFARTLPATLRALPAHRRPTGQLTAIHIDGTHSVEERHKLLAWLANPPEGGWTVTSSARCLNEGIDVPAVDAVVFSRPKSPIETVQAIGRGLRRDRHGTGVATILVPVLLPDDPARVLDDGEDEWAAVWRVIRALRAHDDQFAAQLDTTRYQLATDAHPTLPERILVRLPEGYTVGNLLEHITVRLVENSTPAWYAGYGAARAFKAREGHLRVAGGHQEAGVALAAWLLRQRADHLGGRLDTDKVRLLTDLGFDLSRRQVHRPVSDWEQAFDALQAFAKREGHVRVRRDHVENGIVLSHWITSQRALHQAGRLSAERRRRLVELGVTLDSQAVGWDEAFAALHTFVQREGHFDVPIGHVENGIRVRAWLAGQRRAVLAGRLRADRRQRLVELDIDLSAGAAKWEAGFAALVSFHRRHAHLNVPAFHMEGDIYLFAWVRRQRWEHAQRRLGAQRTRRLTQLGLELPPEGT